MNFQPVMMDIGLSGIWSWAWTSIGQYALFIVVLVIFIRALHKQKVMEGVLAIVVGGFIWFFATGPQTVFQAIAAIMQKLIGG